MQVTDNPSSRVEDLLKGLPEQARLAYQRFRQNNGATDLDAVIHAAIALYLPAGTAADVAKAPDETALVDDLGLDSLGMTELVFFTEDLFGFAIEDEELLGLRTLGNLKDFVRAKLAAAGITVTAP